MRRGGAARSGRRGAGLRQAACDIRTGRGRAQPHRAGGRAATCRSALNALELAVLTTPVERGRLGIHITMEIAEESIQKRRAADATRSMFYDMLSAFCKSLRGSDSDAALAWFARMNYAGVDPRIIVRRDHRACQRGRGAWPIPMAMLQAVAAGQALETDRHARGAPAHRAGHHRGVRESRSRTPWSWRRGQGLCRRGEGRLSAACRCTCATPTMRAAERLGSGEGYQVSRTTIPGTMSRQQYLPLEAGGLPYYQPSDQGQEEKLRARRAERGMK